MYPIYAIDFSKKMCYNSLIEIKNSFKMLEQFPQQPSSQEYKSDAEIQAILVLAEKNREKRVEQEETEIEKEARLEQERLDLRESLETQEVPVTELKKINIDTILEAFIEYKESKDARGTDIWKRVVTKAHDLSGNLMNPFSYWSLLDYTQLPVLNYLRIKNRRQSLRAMQERGFESLEQINIDDMYISQIEKKNPSEVLQKYRNVEKSADCVSQVENEDTFIEIVGKIKLDNFLLTDKMEEFDWKLTFNMDNSNKSLEDGDVTCFLATSIYFDNSDLSKIVSINNGRASGNIGGNRTGSFLSVNQMEKMKKYSFANKFGIKQIDTNGMPAKSSKTLKDVIGNDACRINHRIEAILWARIYYFMRNYVSPAKFRDSTGQIDSTSFKLQTEISTKSEEEIDDMFIEGIESGEFNSMLLYIGEGAQRFIDMTAGEQYRVTGKELLLMRDNMDELADETKDKIIYELGPGDGKKTKELLKAIDEKKENDNNIQYNPVDISPTMVYVTAQELKDIPNIEISGQVCDFHDIKDKVNFNKDNIFLLLGNTLGNGDRNYQVDLLQDIRKAMKPGEKILVGVQLKTDLAAIAKQYEGEGSAKFVKQLLTRFEVPEEDLEIKASPNEDGNEVVVELIFRKETSINYKGLKKEYKVGDSIKMGVSHKYEVTEIDELFNESGFTNIKQISNSNKDYQLILAEANED